MVVLKLCKFIIFKDFFDYRFNPLEGCNLQAMEHLFICGICWLMCGWVTVSQNLNTIINFFVFDTMPHITSPYLFGHTRG